MDLDDQLPYDRARAAAASVRAALPPSLHRPHVAIVCGSGLGGMQDTIQSDPSCPRIEIPYRDIPFFPNPTGEYPSPRPDSAAAVGKTLA